MTPAPDEGNEEQRMSADASARNIARLVEDLRDIAQEKAGDYDCDPSVIAEWKAADLIEQIQREWDEARIVASQLNIALTQNQWGFNHRRCCLCAGFSHKDGSEHDHRHTNDCPVQVALKAYAAIAASTQAGNAGEGNG